MFKNKYRIVLTNRNEYETQMKLWWLPFLWLELGYVNTYSSVDLAQDYIEHHKNKRTKVVKQSREKEMRDLYEAVKNNIETRPRDSKKCGAGCMFKAICGDRCNLFDRFIKGNNRHPECLRIFKAKGE